jgi:hypothetical protein
VALAECASPLIIDRSDPIPNGVFVMSTEFKKRISPENLRALRQRWKSVRNHPVDPAGKTKITGWRERVERDLDLVEYHRDYVEYTKALENDRETLVTVTIVVFIIVLGGMALALRTLGGKEQA